MSIILNLLNFMSFISGIVFGLFIAFVAVVHFLSDHTKKRITQDEVQTAPSTSCTNDPVKVDIPVVVPAQQTTEVRGSYIPQRLAKAEVSRLTEIIQILDELNSPFKNIKPLLERIHSNKEQEAAALEGKMKTIIEYSTLSKMEKDLQDSLSQLKDHAKQIKLVSNFLNDLAKVFSSFSRDVSKVSNSARNNMNKALSNAALNLERKEDLIVNNWWQTLQIALDSFANDQEDLSTVISEELINYSNQIQEEIAIIEKRLTSEGNRQVANLKEQLNIFEQRLKDRDKTKEKLRNTPIQASSSSSSSSANGPSESYQRRAQRLKAAEDVLVAQTKKLYEVQKDFYQLLPKIHSDVQLTIVKSIVETQSQLLKLTDHIERSEASHKSTCSRMRLQLTNAASSLVQMIREDSCLLPSSDDKTSSSSSSIALQVMRSRMVEAGLKGFELTLQHVLEGLLLQSQLAESRERGEGNRSPLPSSSSVAGLALPLGAYRAHSNSSSNGTGGGEGGEDLSSLHLLEDLGKLDMFQEATACLAASNPFILPELPKSFRTAVATETCVWFNAFSGRVYRDVATSTYFHRWFCLKVAQMLNKKRPDYIDQFEVLEVTFGELPPLLLNVKWSPLIRKQQKKNHDNTNNTTTATTSEQEGDKDKEKERARSKSSDSKNNTSFEEEDRDRDRERGQGPREEAEESDSDEEDDDLPPPGEDEEEDEEARKTNNKKRSHKREGEGGGEAGEENPLPTASSSSSSEDSSQYYAACTADVSFRSGIKFTVSTKLWINWPRDRYASVPVMFYVELAELVGKIRFGVEKSHSFLTFLGDPTTRISVRSEVGGDKYKLKDIPQISDYIVKKLKKIIHRRLVYPHAHKFRLIWPRNWWPEGTENLFLPPGERPDSPGINKSNRAASPLPSSQNNNINNNRQPSAEALKSLSSSSPANSNNNSTTAGSNEPVPVAETVSSSKLMEVTSKLMSKARAFNFTSSSSSSSSSSAAAAAAAAAAVSTTPPPNSSSSTSNKIAATASLSPASSSSSSAAAAALKTPPHSHSSLHHQHGSPLPPVSEERGEGDGEQGGEGRAERKWLLHLKEQMDKTSSSSSSLPSSITAIEKRRLLQQFFLKQKKHKTIQTGPSLSGSEKAVNPNPNNPNNSNREKRRVKRSLSISDFRAVTMEVVLESVLERIQSKLLDALDLARRASFSGQGDDKMRDKERGSITGGGGGGMISVNRETSLPNLLRPTRSHSVYGIRTEDPSSSAHPHHNHNNALSSASNSNSSSGGGGGWFSAKGREAKAKLLEFKNKHFGQSNSNTPSTSEKDQAVGDSNPNLDKAYKSAAKIGGKLKDLFSKNQDETDPPLPPSSASSTHNKRGGAGGNPSHSLLGHRDVREEDEDLAGQGQGRTEEEVLPRSADLGLGSGHGSNNLKESTKKFMSSMFGGGGGGGKASSSHGEDFSGFVRSSRVVSSDAGSTKESRANSILTKALTSPVPSNSSHPDPRVQDNND